MTRLQLGADIVLRRAAITEPMANNVRLSRDTAGVLRFDYGTPAGPASPANNTPVGKPVQRSPRLVIDDSVTRDRPASASLWGEVSRRLDGFLDDAAEAPPKNPAEAFSSRARNEPWFVSAKMVRPKGGRKVGGTTALRTPRLEVTVRHGHAATAESVMRELGLTGLVVEQRAIPGAYGRGRR